MTENWKPIARFPGYEASDSGRIRSIDRLDRLGRLRPGTVLKHHTSKSCPYPMVGFWREGRRYPIMVHAIIAETWLPPKPSPKHEIAHWDGDKHNNAPANLRWATVIENTADKVRHGRVIRGEASKSAKLTELAVCAIRADPRPMIEIANEYGVHYQTIYRIKARILWAHI